MDPTACYRDMLASLQDSDIEAARKHALNLRRWLNSGGFCPQDQDIVAVRSQLDRVLRMTAVQHNK
jgi:hypothetical protein